jgi:hypothetical protein
MYERPWHAISCIQDLSSVFTSYQYICLINALSQRYLISLYCYRLNIFSRELRSEVLQRYVLSLLNKSYLTEDY